MCEGSLPKEKGKTHYMVKIMHIAKLKDLKETNMMKEAEWKLEEQNNNINTMNNGVMENGRIDGGKKAYGDGQEKNTPLGVWILQDKCGGRPLEELSTLTR